MVGDREGKWCAKDGERRKNINCLENADLKDVWGLRRMRQGKSCRHVVLYYPTWEVFYIFNCYRVIVPASACFQACGRANWNCRAWHCSRGFGKQEGFGAVRQLGHRTQKVQSAHTAGPCLPVSCSFQDLNCNTSPGVRLTSHLLLWGCAWKLEHLCWTLRCHQRGIWSDVTLQGKLPQPPAAPVRHKGSSGTNQRVLISWKQKWEVLGPTSKIYPSSVTEGEIVFAAFVFSFLQVWLCLAMPCSALRRGLFTRFLCSLL